MKDRFIIVGKKVGMTRFFDEENKRLLPVTAIVAEPCRVSQIKTHEKEGYQAIQLAYQSTNHLTKPAEGHLKKANIEEKLLHLKEFTTDDVSGFQLGQSLNVDSFAEGQLVDVIATSKGKGFQGVVFRYRFGGGRATHGSMSHRRGGGYGHFRRMGHIIKNQKMPGHMGCVRSTVRNLKIMKIVPEKRLIVLKGSVPGAKDGFVMIRKAKSVA
ncbi:MAG: 50S ribosomal protein L3 [Opitutales bacterium]|nr:50S ribosomal protein L3 [Opitutales bacterium]